jgi:ligand-binding SRPBCC domain-containing protein
MRLYTLQTKQVIPVGIDEAWEFFSDPRNLSRITPASMRFEVTSGLADRTYAGMIITYRVRPLLGIAVRWVTEITHLSRPSLFVDEQRFGPYRFWHHQHHFRQVDGGTEICDIVSYAPPRPVAGLVNRWMVGPQLRRIFEFRRDALKTIFGGASP